MIVYLYWLVWITFSFWILKVVWFCTFDSFFEGYTGRNCGCGEKLAWEMACESYISHPFSGPPHLTPRKSPFPQAEFSALLKPRKTVSFLQSSRCERHFDLLHDGYIPDLPRTPKLVEVLVFGQLLIVDLGIVFALPLSWKHPSLKS